MNEAINSSVDVKSKAQREYLRVLCHDLEAPLKLTQYSVSSIRGAVDSELFKDAKRNLERMQGIIDRAKVAAVVEDGKITARFSQNEINQLVDTSIDHLSARASLKDIRIEVLSTEKIAVSTDADLFVEQVLGNILSNAVKFSPTGGRIEVLIQRDAQGFAVVEVRDRGRGIPVQFKEKLFDPRKSISTVGTFGETGLGYGLSIAKSAVEALKGSIEIHSVTVHESPENHGTTVKIMIPTEAVVS
jgi:signal transduction histidine kinase